MVKCRQAAISDLPSYDIFVPQKVSLLKIFDDVIACDLWFRPPNQKFWLRLRVGNCLKNFFEDLFFLKSTCCLSLVLGLGLEHSCPWPREGLSSERLSLALASDFFFCVLGLGLEPCVLNSTSVANSATI